MLGELVEVGADLRGRADGAVLGHLQNLLTRGGVEQHVRFVVRELASASEKKADARTLGREEVLLSLLMGVGGDDVDARDDVRLRQLLRRLELASIYLTIYPPQNRVVKTLQNHRYLNIDFGMF